MSERWPPECTGLGQCHAADYAERIRALEERVALLTRIGNEALAATEGAVDRWTARARALPPRCGCVLLIDDGGVTCDEHTRPEYLTPAAKRRLRKLRRGSAEDR